MRASGQAFKFSISFSVHTLLVLYYVPHITTAMLSTLSFRRASSQSSVRFASSMNSNTLYLGLDSSTQGLKATAIDSSFNVKASFAINYQKDLPHYNLKNGVHEKPSNVVTQPTLMVRSFMFATSLCGLQCGGGGVENLNADSLSPFPPTPYLPSL